MDHTALDPIRNPIRNPIRDATWDPIWDTVDRLRVQLDERSTRSPGEETLLRPLRSL
ncbi:hypothetical protein [Streptomyces katsurahamanus]|uniref:hypothetical protein n=1 Tax=Streptomyces katsurahamanus TaxID=2577098 RepID=UPI00129664F0|nr:hypothetical protein [Streptomyces katsurahamanus]